MRNEKIFNAVEHLKDKFIIEAMEEYGSAENINLESEYPVDLCSEGIMFSAENVKREKSITFIKWAGLAAGVCAVTASAVIMGSSGLFHGNITLPSDTAAKIIAATDSVTAAPEPNEPVVKLYTIDNLKAEYNLEKLNITDSCLIEEMKSGRTVEYAGKLYYVKQSDEEQRVSVYSYDINKNSAAAVFEAEDKRASQRTITLLCGYSGCIYYEDADYNYNYDANGSTGRKCICRFNLETKKIEEIYAESDSRQKIAGTSFVGTVKHAGRYLFFDEITIINESNDRIGVINKYDMQSNTLTVLKENASLITPHGDKLMFFRTGENGGVYFCNIEDGENEEKIEDIFCYFNGIPDFRICSDGENVWMAGDIAELKYGGISNRIGREDIIKLNEDTYELEVVKVIADTHDCPLSAANGRIVVSDRILFDSHSGECIMAGNYISLFTVGNELYCFDELSFELFRFPSEPSQFQ